MRKVTTHSNALPTQTGAAIGRSKSARAPNSDKPVYRDARPPKSNASGRLITTHEELFAWLAVQLPEATLKVKAAQFFVAEAYDVVSSFESDGQFFLDQWAFHYFLHVAFREPFEKKETCSEALLWFLSQVYATAAVGAGVPCKLEMANQIAISALDLDPEFIRLGKGSIRSTKRCRNELGVAIRVALDDEPYEVIPL